MSHTLPTTSSPQGEAAGVDDSQIQAEVKQLLGRGELPVQEVTGLLRPRFSSERIIAVITEMVRSGRLHMTDSYPIRLRLRYSSSAS